MERQTAQQMHYLDLGRVKKLAVRKKGETDFQPIHLEIVEVSLDVCCFEREGRQEFQVGEELEFLFDIEDSCLSANATIGWVAKCELLDENYERRVWFTYGAEFGGEIDTDFFRRIAGDPKKSGSLGPDCIIIS
jgi:hypothetical protein